MNSVSLCAAIAKRSVLETKTLERRDTCNGNVFAATTHADYECLELESPESKLLIDFALDSCIELNTEVGSLYMGSTNHQLVNVFFYSGENCTGITSDIDENKDKDTNEDLCYRAAVKNPSMPLDPTFFGAISFQVVS